MGRNKKTETERKAERAQKRFDACYRIGKVKTGLKAPQVAAIAGISVSTFQKYKNDPRKYFSLEELDKIGSALGFTDEDYLAIQKGM